MPFPDEIDVTISLGELIPELYREFQLCFDSAAPLAFKGKKVTYDTRKGEGGYEEGFWHLVTCGEPRVFDPKRACKLGWVRDIILGGVPKTSRWIYLEGSGIYRTYLWVEEHSYIVVLEERKDHVFLVTAFDVKEWNVSVLQKKRNNGVVF